MFKPAFEEFKARTRQGNLIPVYREILADLETPVSAYMKIGQGAYSFLLESVEGGEKWARYCFLGCDPAIVVRIKGRKIVVCRNGVEAESSVADGENPLLALRKLLAEYKPVAADDLPRFTGGAVGFISYDMVRFFEKLPDCTTDDLDISDALFVITDTLLIFDNVLQTIKIVSNAFVDNGDLEEIYRQTTRKIELLEEKLQQPVPRKFMPRKQTSSPPSAVFRPNVSKHPQAVRIRIQVVFFRGSWERAPKR